MYVCYGCVCVWAWLFYIFIFYYLLFTFVIFILKIYTKFGCNSCFKSKKKKVHLKFNFVIQNGPKNQYCLVLVVCVCFLFCFIFHTTVTAFFLSFVHSFFLYLFIYFATVTESQAEVRWQLPRKEYTKRSIICNNEKYRIFLTQNINFLHYIFLYRSYKSNICEQTNVSDFKYCTQIYINKHMLCVLYTHNINKISVKKVFLNLSRKGFQWHGYWMKTSLEMWLYL